MQIYLQARICYKKHEPEFILLEDSDSDGDDAIVVKKSTKLL